MFDALVVPLGSEMSAVKRGADSSRVLVGIRAGAGAGLDLDGIDANASVVVMGLCGALDPALDVGDAIVYADIIDGDTIIALDPELTAELEARFGRAGMRAAFSEHVVTTASAKLALAERTLAEVVDMEAAPLARACAARGIRVAMVRIVSDDSSGDLPPLGNVYSADGKLKPFDVATALLSTPARSLRFIGNVQTALAALTRAAALM